MKPMCTLLTHEEYLKIPLIHDAYLYIPLTHEANLCIPLTHKAYLYIPLTHETNLYISLTYKAHLYIPLTHEAYLCISRTCEAHLPIPLKRETYLYTQTEPVPSSWTTRRLCHLFLLSPQVHCWRGSGQCGLHTLLVARLLDGAFLEYHSYTLLYRW